MSTPTKGAMSAARSLFPRIKFRSNSHEAIAAIIDSHTHAAELDAALREVLETEAEHEAFSCTLNLSKKNDALYKARALLAKLEGGK